jgi:filamentous hemagglutinin family protein
MALVSPYSNAANGPGDKFAMVGKLNLTAQFRRLSRPAARLLAVVTLGAGFVEGTVHASDILRRGASASAATDATPATSGGTSAATAPAVASGQDRLARTTQALEAVKQMQNAARNLALTGPNYLKAGLPVVPVNSYGVANGLMPALAVPKDLTKPVAGEDASLWTGASLPKVATQTSNGDTTSTVTITQNQQQAILNWQTFNIGKNTTLNFDQSAGGANVGQWIAFNKIGVTGSPSQILGSIKAQGQVYVINPNGIIFGGSAQVNTHALVASSLPINDNLISRGLLNNPDAQFLFSTLTLGAGKNGTPAFTPAITDEFVLTGTTSEHALALKPATGVSPTVSYVSSDPAAAALKAGDDYTLSTPGADGKMTVTFTPAGRQKVDGSTVRVAYTPTGDQYGNVEVQAGAQLTAPTNADRVGGRVALIGTNVTNAGTISAPDGQAILAAGLQVGLDASSDPGLRGLNVYVGAVTDAAGSTTAGAGTVTNDRTVNADGTVYTGLISTPRASVTMAGKTVNQLGFIDSSTSVSLNGRVDLLAEYNAVVNPKYTPGLNFQLFLRQSTDTDVSTGTVTLGPGSVTRILPELTSTEKVVGTKLTLPSQINIRGLAIHLASTGTEATAATVFAPSGQVAMEAGQWVAANGNEDFVHTDGQIYFDAGAAVDVAGSQGVAASVTDNIVSVELRGPQLADSPLQRDGPLRGQTVQVDLRQIGTYKGRAWAGTPLADASGYIGLVQRTVGQLTADGGHVTLAAGNSIVLSKAATVNVSGGWIDYQGGNIQTTKLVADGHVIDIAQATPDRKYDGIYTGTTTTTDQKWGVVSASANPLAQSTYENGYRQGGSGGSLAITAPAMVLDGNLYGNTVAGPQQRTAAGQLARTFADPSVAAILPAIRAALARPDPSTLTLQFSQEYHNAGLVFSRSPTPPKIVFPTSGAGLTPAPVEAFPNGLAGKKFASLGTRGQAGAEIDLSPNLVSADFAQGSGFGGLTISNSDGDIRIDSNLAITPGGFLTLDAANIRIGRNLSISTPGGSLSFTAHNLSPFTHAFNASQNVFDLPAPDATRGLFSLGSGTLLSTAGLAVNDRAGSSGAGNSSLFINGYRLDSSTGSEIDAVSIRAYRVELENGSTIDVSGGVTAGATGKMTYGNAGKLSILGVLDPQGVIDLPIGQDPDDPTNTKALRGCLHFNPDKVQLKGYAGQGARSGALTLRAQLIQIEDPLALADVADKALLSPLNLDAASTLLLAPGFFSQGGFGSFSLIGLGELAKDAKGNILQDPASPGFLYVPGVYVAAGLKAANGQVLGTTIAPHAASWLASADPANGGKLILQADPVLLPPGARNPVGIRLTAAGISYSNGSNNLVFARGDLKFGQGATIQVDAQGSVALAGDTVQVDGKIAAPAGTIEIKGGSSYVDPSGTAPTDKALPTVVLGPQSSLTAVGAVLEPAGLSFNPGILGNINTGTVLPGGRISVQGNIVAQKSALLDVSGTSGTLDLLPGYTGASGLSSLVATPVASDGGTISLQGSQLLVTNATLRGAAGGATAQGGSLTISSGRFTPVPVTPADINLDVTQTAPVLPTSGAVLGLELFDADKNPITGEGHFGAADFWNPITNSTVGGFGALTLEGNVQFSGPVELGAGRSLTLGTGGLIYSAALGKATSQKVVLKAPSVTLGLPFQPPVQTGPGSIPPVSIYRDITNAPFYVAPQAGPGSIEVKAESLISLGNLSLQGISAASFSTEKNGRAVAGDIRGNGTLDIAGALDFTAGQIYPPTAVSFTVAAYDYTTADDVVHAGSVTFHPVLDAAGAALLPALPLSAGGQLTVYASRITQGGTLRAPLGTINLGWNGVGSPPTSVNGVPADLLVGPDSLPVPTTGTLTMAKGSVTSVSGIDPKTGKAVTIPYGYSPDGTTWVDPSGIDITVTGPPRKSVITSAVELIDEKGSSIDISGGGDLYAYRWVKGVGGTKDVLDPSYVPNPSTPSLLSFAVLPDYQSGFAPYAPFGSGAANQGYVANASLVEGDTVHLDLNNGLGAKDYTLLPARYALQPGAYLITAVSGPPPGTPIVQPDGTTITAGYRANYFTGLTGSPVRTAFEVAVGTVPVSTTPSPVKSVVRVRSQYDDFLANGFFTQSALTANLPVWRLPVDSGYLLLTAASGGTIKFEGAISGKPQANGNGKGGIVDINSPSDILIASSQASDATAAVIASDLGLTDPLVLDAATLNNFGAESLLIGGYRTSGPTGMAVNVSTGKLAVSNAGEALRGSDIILVANNSLLVDTDASIAPSGTLTGADELVFGRFDPVGVPVAGSGNGVVLRVSSDAGAQINRHGADQSTAAALTIAKGAQLGGATGSLTLDSTNTTKLDPAATLRGAAIALGSGQISLQFAGAGELRTQAGGTVTGGLVLSGTGLQTLAASAKTLSLRSYTSIDLYGDGKLGSADFARITLHTPEIFGDGGNVTFEARNISLDNDSKSAPADVKVPPTKSGSLKFSADTFGLGAGQVSVNQYGSLEVIAGTSVTLGGTGSLTTQDDLTFKTPLVTGATAADQKITAGGVLTVAGTAGTAQGDGLAARLALEGSEINVSSRIHLASGVLSLHATGNGPDDNVSVSGIVDVSGTVRKFYDLPKYSNGGQVSLIADDGNVSVTKTGIVIVSGAETDPADKAGAGAVYSSAAGSLTVGAQNGIFSVEGKISGQGATSAQGGSFSLDAGTIPLEGSGPSLAPLEHALALGGYTRSQAIRVRRGNVVVDDVVTAHDFSLSADQGSIDVAGTGIIDASGETGGAINLAARGSVTVDSGAVLTVKADNFNAAGKGGAVRLEAGAARFDSAGTFVAPDPTAAVEIKGTVELSVGRDSIDLPLNATLQFPQGTVGGKVAFSQAGVYVGSDGKSASFAAGDKISLMAGATVTLAKAGEATFAGDGKGGSIAVVLPDGRTVALRPTRGTSAALAATLADASVGKNTGTLHLRAPQLDASGVPIPAGNTGAAGTDVAVRPIAGSIVDASSIVVEGYKVFIPVAGAIDTVESSVATNGQSFASHAGTTAAPGTILGRLLSGVADPAVRDGLAAVMHIRPGAEIVNTANPGQPINATITAGTTNTTIALVESGSFTLGSLSASAGRIVSTTSSGRIIRPDGSSMVLKATDRNLILTAGSTVVLDGAGTVTLGITKTGTAAGNGTLVLAAGTILGGTSPVSFSAGSGTNLTLNTAGSSAVTVAAGNLVVLPNGGRVRFSSSGSITSSTGSVTTFSAASTVTVATGSTIKLNSTGTITYVGGLVPVSLALSGGSYSTTGSNTINTSVGSLTLARDWNLAANRYLPGPGAVVGEPGMLTLRAAGNLIFNGALSDGFTSSAYDAPLLTSGAQSSSYRLVAGADLSAADFHQVQPLSALGMSAGSLRLGRNGNGAAAGGPNALTKNILYGTVGDPLESRFQVIRTGTGDIDIAVGRDVLLLNQFAAIYTAGTNTSDPTLGGTFDLPVLDQDQHSSGRPLGAAQQETSYPTQYSLNGGDITIHAQGDIARKTQDTVGRLIDDSQQQLPNNWLYRRGMVDPVTGDFFQGTVDPDAAKLVRSDTGEVMSTTWWVDFSNFFEGVGALGGGNVSLVAGRDIMNVDAVVPTNARMAGKDNQSVPLAPNAANLVELGGGDLVVAAARDINGGVYYVERGHGSLDAGRSILTNQTRAFGRVKTVAETWLPTTLFLGKGDFTVAAYGDLRLGPVANPFLLPAGISNTPWDKSYFSTFEPNSGVDVSSLTGSIRLTEGAPNPDIYLWLSSVQVLSTANASNSRPWLRLAENNVQSFGTAVALTPATLRAVAFSGDLNVVGDLSLAPSPQGTIDLVAAGSISGLNPINNTKAWGYSTIRLLDSAPDSLPSITKPLSTVEWSVPSNTFVATSIYAGINGLFRETESTDSDSLQTKLSRHSTGPLHQDDSVPVRLYATKGDISGLSLFAGKPARIVAADDITDISLLLQNNRAGDISLVAAGRDIVAYAPNTPLRQAAQLATFAVAANKTSGESGQLEIGGPGALEVLAGRNLDLGVDPFGAALGITSIGSARNPSLPFGGANIVAAAGLGEIYQSAASLRLLVPGLLSTPLGFGSFVENFLQPGATRGDRYLPALGVALGLAANTTMADIAANVAAESLTEGKALALLEIYNRVLRDSARDRNDPDSPTFGQYTDGFAAIAALFPGSPQPTKQDLTSTNPVIRPAGPWVGSLSLSTKEIKTSEGGDISLLVPGGNVTVGRATDPQKPDQGILTERGGAVSIFAADSVNVGTSRIFTLRGGNEIVWSTWGNIAAGSGSKTVFSAPPTRVLIDPQSGDVQNDLAGLATGSGIGVLATLSGVKPGDVDLIAPVGTIDAGDAGIRSSGNLNLAARVVLNASNIQVGGTSAGTPPPPPAPNLGSLTAASTASAGASNTATEVAKQGAAANQMTELPSMITVEVLGYGGDDDDDADKKGSAAAEAKSSSP